MTSTRRLATCCTMVALVHARAAAQSTISEDVPVPGGTAAFARALDIDPVPDRGRFLAELTRLQPDPQRLKTLPAPSRSGDADLVPVPLTAAIWAQAIFHRPPEAATLVSAILGDRQASLLCRGLTALDDETLEFLGSHPSLLTRLYESDAPAFSAFAGSLHVRGGRVVPPGGTGAAPLWESALDARADQPERFIRSLFERGDGRIAYLYDVVAQLAPPRAAFALGLSGETPASRAERFKALVAATITSQHEWRVKVFPFARPLYDIASVLTRVRLDAGGRPLLPDARLWTSVFDSGELPADPGGVLHSSPATGAIDAAWLAEAIAARDVRQREDRVDQLAFGQRVFASAPDAALPDVLTALRAFPRQRMLMLTFERIGITNPAVYADAARSAHRLSALNPTRGFAAHAQLQGALALIARMARVRTIDTAKAEALISSVIAVPLNDEGRYAGAMARWVRQTLGPALSPADTIEAAILAALAGRPAESGAAWLARPLVSWEGRRYRLDLPATELRRLHRIREKQGGVTVDAAVTLDSAAETLARDGVTAADARAAMAQLQAIAELAPWTRIDREMLPPGIEAPKDARDVLDRALKELAKLDLTRDSGATRPRRAAQPAITPVEELADAVLADAVLSLAYAVDLGDSDGTVLLAGNVAPRHDFGFGIRDGDQRQRFAWAMPRQDLVPGLPWHVSGSLLGLDVALAPLALRRLSPDPVAAAPKLTSNERESFAISVALMDPLALRDADRDVIAAAVGQGRRRVAALAADTFDAAADEIAMDGWRRRAVRWTMANEPARVPSMFSMTEVLVLGGGPPPAALDAWGMSAHASEGCLCTRLAPPGRWALLVGRPQLGLMASGVADLNLHVAVVLHELRLPAPLARHVLTAAVQDFIDRVQPADAYDWLTLVRTAQHLSREQVEDYVASAAADGPLVPEPSGGAPPP